MATNIGRCSDGGERSQMLVKWRQLSRRLRRIMAPNKFIKSNKLYNMHCIVNVTVEKHI